MSPSLPKTPADKVDAALVAAVRNLEAAVGEQERAVNRILGLAELLMERHADRATLLRLEGIMEACAFQDLTGQRIRKVSRFLRLLADNKGLSDALVPPHDDTSGPDTDKSKGLSQEEVDRLLNNR
jgi:chemotaxis regulatin CheY-phosphate phosphatase CheZ